MDHAAAPGLAPSTACVRRCGVDRDGRAVFLFQPAQLPEGVDLERVTMYAIHVMHEHVVRERHAVLHLRESGGLSFIPGPTR